MIFFLSVDNKTMGGEECMRQEKKQKDKTAAVLVLCFCLMALVSVFVVKANIDKLRDNMDSTETADVVKKQTVAQEEETEAETPVVDSRQQESEGSGASSSEFIVPLEGKIIMDYSMDMPIYWATLDPRGSGYRRLRGI